MFRLLRALRPILFAALALMLLVTAFELGLRVYDSHTRAITGRAPVDDPLLAHSWCRNRELKPGRKVFARNPDDGERVVVRTNGFGLRGAEPALPKPAGTYRVILLGGESVLGPDVGEADTTAARLQRYLQSQTTRRVEVLNAGVPGYCPLLSYLQVRQSLLALQADLYVLDFEAGDVADDRRVRRHTEVDDDGTPVVSVHPLLARRANAREEPALFLLPTWCKQRASRLLGMGVAEAPTDEAGEAGRYAWLRGESKSPPIHLAHALQPAGRLARLVRPQAELVVAFRPAPWQLSANACSPEVRRRYGVEADEVLSSRTPYEQVGALLAKHGIPYCDPSEEFARLEEPEGLYLQQAPRLSRAGHDRYARVLAAFLVQEVPGPWRRSPDARRVPRTATAPP